MTVAALQTWAEEATRSGVVGVSVAANDTTAWRAEVLGIALAIAPGRACYVPLGHEALGELGAEPPLQLVREDAFGVLAPLLQNSSVLKVFVDAKFDLLVLQRAGLSSVGPIDDSTLICYGQEAGAHGFAMEELARLHLGHTPVPPDQVTGSGRARLKLAQVKPDLAATLVAEMADIGLRLWHVLRPRLRTNLALALYEQVDRRLTPVLMSMEQAGVKVDAAELKRMSLDFAGRMAVMEQDIFRFAGRSFNLGSPKQLGEVMFDEMHLPGGKRMKTGAWGTDAAVLQGLAEEGHELPARVLDWRQLAKLKSTYADALVDEINPETGRVHTRFAMAATTTGRLSSIDPNLQNIPIRTEEGGRIRRAFIAEPGHVLISADYSQIELRLLAHVADIPVLRESFANGEDIHARTASEGVRSPYGRDGPSDAAPGKGDQFRYYLRH